MVDGNTIVGAQAGIEEITSRQEVREQFRYAAHCYNNSISQELIQGSMRTILILPKGIPSMTSHQVPIPQHLHTED
jgi:hypothetical protein